MEVLMLPPLTFPWLGGGKVVMSFSRVQGGKHPSMESVQEQQDGADADDAAQNEGIPPLPKVDPLDQAVHCWKTVWEGAESRS